MRSCSSGVGGRRRMPPMAFSRRVLCPARVATLMAGRV